MRGRLSHLTHRILWVTTILPTYLDPKKIANEQRSPIIESCQAEMLVPGSASVVIIEDKEAVLFARTLADAEREYRKDHHKLVVVVKSEPANSHPVVNFSGLGVPCLYYSNGSAVQKLIDGVNVEHPLVVCMQAATLNLWNRSFCMPEGFVSQGFVVHPAKVAMSQELQDVPVRMPGVSLEVPKELKELVLTIRTAAMHRIALEKLQELRGHGWVEQLQVRKKQLREWLQQTSFKVVSVEHAAGLRLKQISKENRRDFCRTTRRSLSTSTLTSIQRFCHRLLGLLSLS